MDTAYYVHNLESPNKSQLFYSLGIVPGIFIYLLIFILYSSPPPHYLCSLFSKKKQEEKQQNVSQTILPLMSLLSVGVCGGGIDIIIKIVIYDLI